MTRAEAYCRQARSDLRVFESLAAQDAERVEECHPLHYLQMAAEKITKALALAWGIPLRKDGYSHVAFSNLPQHLKTPKRQVAHVFGMPDPKAFSAYLDGVQYWCRQIEELCPAVGPQGQDGGPKNAPNVEYPWQAQIEGLTWRAPADWKFRLLYGSDGKRTHGLRKALDFVRKLINRFDNLAKLAPLTSP